MAKIVIAGKADCPYYAKAELLGDELTKNLPDFNLHKIVLHPNEWDTWIEKTCSDRGWHQKKSPIIWRELIDRGGKGVLIGSCNEFMEYAFQYYGISSSLMSDDLLKIKDENLRWKEEADEEAKLLKSQSNPMKICITSAAGIDAYMLAEEIIRGDVFGEDEEIALHLLDEEENLSMLDGLSMEACDEATKPLRNVSITCDSQKAFCGCKIIVLMDDTAQNEDESKEEWLSRNKELYHSYIKSIEAAADKDVKILLAGCGPVNFNAFVMMENCKIIRKTNIIASSRLIENQVKAVMSEKLKVNSAFVVDCLVWGNVSGEHYIDIGGSRVHNYDGAIWGPPFYSRSAVEMVHDNKWLETEFPELVKSRTAVELEKTSRRLSIARSSAAASLLRHWWSGSPHGQMYSLAVRSEGWYGVDEGLVFSVPVTFSPRGHYSVRQDLHLTDIMKEKIATCTKDLLSEKYLLYPELKPVTPDEKKGDEPKSEQPAEQTTDSDEKAEVADESSLQKPSLERIAEDPAAEEQAETQEAPSVPGTAADTDASQAGEQAPPTEETQQAAE